MAKDKLLDKYLKEYQNNAEKHLKDEAHFVFDYYKFFQKINWKNITWTGVKEICNHIHSFNALALAKVRATKEKDGKPVHHSEEHYRKAFHYLKYGNEKVNKLPEEERDIIIFNNLLGDKNKKSEYNEDYKLAYFGVSSMSEIIGQVYAQKYVFYNRRDIEALISLGFARDVKKIEKVKNFGERFIEYNKIINNKIRPVFQLYFDEVYVKSKQVPENILIDQFFSWVYMNKVFTEEKLEEKYRGNIKGKVSRVFIKNYNQLQDITLDLTYPQGHEKAGKPLDKICIIGQSGMGKTTLLNLIFGLTANNTQTLAIEAEHEVEITHILANNQGELEIISQLENKKIVTKVNKNIEGDLETAIQLDAAFPRLMYLPSDTIRQTDVFNKKIKEDIKEVNDKDIEIVDLRFENKGKSIEALWNRISKKVSDYRKEEVKWSLEISSVLQNGGIDKAQALSKKFVEWKKSNSPFTEFKEAVEEQFLKEFNIQLLDNAQSTDDLKYIQFTSTLIENGKPIPIHQLSTGTKQVLIKTLPFWALKDKNEDVVRPFKSIILIDEPENSLYPDRQKLIVKHFQKNLTTEENDCQFFYATHSPVLLASFDPCEIIVLEKKKGKIKQRLLYKEKRHVDNYIDHPKYLRWDDILIKYLGLEDEGGEEREETIHRIAQIKQELKYPNGDSQQKKEKLLDEYEEKAMLLNWKL